MSYIKQICDGYNKKSLLGNWYEERKYPDQPFRQEHKKQARNKDEGITCFDEKGSQRALPRIQRRSKWETAGRIVLDDGYITPSTTMKASFHYKELPTASKLTRQPFNKNFSQVYSTQLHPNSQIRPNKQQYKMLNNKTFSEVHGRQQLQTSDFRQKMPKTLPHQKYTNYVSQYKLNYLMPQQNLRNNKTMQNAGNFNPNPQENVRISTTMIGEYKKESADQKEETDIQRSWVPPKDKSFIYGVGKTPRQIKKGKIPENDIQTSLNMNIGMHNIHPKNVVNGYFGHKLSEITKNANRSPCNR